MNIQEIKNLKVGKVLENIDLKKYTTYSAGGIGRVLVLPESVESLKILLQHLKDNKIKHKVLGFGSNLIFVNDNYDGVLIRLDELNDLEIIGSTVKVGAGYNLIKLCLTVAKHDLTGLEFASGIPGSIGGAVYMNAGAYKSDMGYVIEKIKVLTPDLEVKNLYNKELDFHYRTSFLQKNPGYICLNATLKLKHGKKDAIMAVIRDRKLRRLESQPLEFPSAGSVFRNPLNDYAGRLIEELGFKGYNIGGACVSEKHANFIINTGGATGSDIKKLIIEIQSKVKEKYGIELKVEQEFVE